MSASMQAYCGLDCSDCPAHLVLVNDDDKLRRQTVEKWNSPSFPVTAENLDCAGCKSRGPRFVFCSKCGVRLCASKKRVQTCSHCENYGCSTLEEWLSHAGDTARERLEKLHSSL